MRHSCRSPVIREGQLVAVPGSTVIITRVMKATPPERQLCPRKPSFGIAPPPRPRSRLHAETPTSCPELRAPGHSWHGHAPPLDGHPTPYAAAVSQLRRQHVHVSLKVDVIDQLSGLFGPFSASTVRQLTTVLKLGHMIRRTHNPLVPGSSPGGPTISIIFL